MPSGGKRKNVRKQPETIRANRHATQKEEEMKWRRGMWSKYGRDYWEEELKKGNPKAHELLLKRTIPEVAKHELGGTAEDGEIRITIKKPE